MAYLPRLAAVAILIGLCFALTTTAAAYASRRDALRVLDTDTASRLHADYSRDPDSVRLRRLDPRIIEDAARDDEALLTTSTPQRVSIAREPTPTLLPTDTPRATSTASPEVRATSTPPPSVTPEATSTPVRTATPPPPTPAPAPATLAPETVVPPDTATPLPRATDTPVIKPTETPVRPTPTRTPSATPTLTNTPQPADTVAPIPTSTHTPTATFTGTPTPIPSNTPVPAPTLTPTLTPTPTNTPAPTPTPTDTSTPPPTPTPADTPTITPTPTATPGSQTTILGASADAYIEPGNPTANYGAATLLRVDGSAASAKRMLVAFNVNSGIPGGATVQSATLTLCMQNIQSAAVGRTHGAHVITSAWTETGATWNSVPTFNGIASGTLVVPLATGCLDIDVTSDVQSWIDGQPNYGWLLRDASESALGLATVDYASRENETSSQRPTLSITYIP